MWPYTASSCCCQVQSLSWVPVRPPIAASPSPHSAISATFRSPHTAGVFTFFVIGCCRLRASHSCCQAPNLPWAPIPPPPHAA
ncbi:unnamed protein product, partial [Staurois parvus]